MSQEALNTLRFIYQQFARGEFGAVDDLGDDVEVVTASQMPDAVPIAERQPEGG